MERLALAIGVLALGFTATAPAHADFAIVKFNRTCSRTTIQRHGGQLAAAEGLVDAFPDSDGDFAERSSAA
jgi:hypothetical protein